MKIAVIGSRNFTDLARLFTALDQLEITEIISGGASGADTLAEKYAEKNNIPVTVFKPDWKRHGRAAGPIRNKDIVDASDIVVAFWDGKSRGTKSSIEIAKKQKKEVKIYYFGENNE